MEAYHSAGADLNPARYLEIRYEDFVAAPVESMRRMTDFVGLGWSVRMECAVARNKIVASRKRAFEQDLTAVQVAELERVMGDMLQRYGYS